jgi:Na+-transporting NADH:ubiquinone oxidoreductase subunit NqrB
VGGGDEDFVDPARARRATVFVVLKRQLSDRRQWVSVKLRKEDESGTRSRGPKRRT